MAISGRPEIAGRRPVRPHVATSISVASAASFRQLPYALPIAVCQSQLLRATPSLDPSLGRNRVGDPSEILAPNQGDGGARPRVTAGERARVVLIDARRHILAGRAADVQ